MFGSFSLTFLINHIAPFSYISFIDRLAYHIQQSNHKWVYKNRNYPCLTPLFPLLFRTKWKIRWPRHIRFAFGDYCLRNNSDLFTYTQVWWTGHYGGWWTIDGRPFAWQTFFGYDSPWWKIHGLHRSCQFLKSPDFSRLHYQVCTRRRMTKRKVHWFFIQ